MPERVEPESLAKTSVVHNFALGLPFGLATLRLHRATINSAKARSRRRGRLQPGSALTVYNKPRSTPVMSRETVK